MSQFRASTLAKLFTAFISRRCPSLVTILLYNSKVICNNGTAMNYKRKTLLLTQWLSLQFQRLFLWLYPLSHSTIHLLTQQYFLGLTVCQHCTGAGARIKSET